MKKRRGIPVKIYDPEPRYIGTIESGIFKKNVCKSKHFHRETHSWGIQESAIEILKRHNTKTIEIRDKESSRVYKVSFDTFLAYAFSKDWGFGRQLFLPLKYWEVDGAGFEQPSLFN